ncbi:MAG: DUF2605 domain-containing protein [Xenococcus sp. MO_188.B8]|nr:DUF2605 domain-containing protein [Xenococcus sp. MO_188.B8]
MSPQQPTEKELLETLLEPLLEDIQFWFNRSVSLLESETMPFFSRSEQAQLLKKIKHHQQEVNTAQMLFQATGKQVGVSPTTLFEWHQVVAECWSVAKRWHQTKNNDTISPN